MWIILRTAKVRRHDVRTYLGPVFRFWYRVWWRWRRFGLPNGRGWRNEPETVVSVLELFEDELDNWKTWRGVKSGE